MADVVYPPAFTRRVLSHEAPGGEPGALSISAPTITAAGEPFAVHVALADAMGYPSVEFDGAVTLRGEFASPGEVEVRFERGAPAVARVEGLTIDAEGTYRFEAEFGGRTVHSNPTVTREAPRQRILWGDPHVHTVLSDCHPDRCRSLVFCFEAARWFAALDFVSAADHVSNGRCELARWKDEAATSDAYDDPPEFVTLPAYEASFKGGAGGDNNVYMRRWCDLFVEDYETGDVKTMCEQLTEKLKPVEDFFVVPHHTTRTGKHGEIPDAIYPGAELMPVIEVHSKWGTSEYRGNPNPLHEVHEGPSYAVDLLNRGLRLGFIGGTDTHATMPAGFGDDHLDRLPGMTAVWAGERTREAVYEGILNRNCYATSLERIYLDARIAGAAGGEAVAWSDPSAPREVAATVAAPGAIVSVEVVRNGETIHSQSPGDWRAELSFTDDDRLDALALESKHLGRFAYYYVRVTCASGAQAWSGPVWLTL